MKKIFSAVLAIILVLSLAACGKKDTQTSTSATVSTSVSLPSDEPAGNDTEPVSKPVEEPVIESHEDLFVPSDDPYVNQFLEAQRIWFLFETGVSMDFEDIKKGELYGYEADFTA